MNYVKFFNEITRNNLDIAGGKGANLGELYNSEFRVPNGFVITTKAFQEIVSPKIREKSKKKIKEVDMENHNKLQVVSEELKSLLLKEIPNGIKKEIKEAYKNLGNSIVSVRSSGTSEDSKENSFAGQFTTFLNINNQEELLEMVKECWASIFNPRVLLYKKAKGLSDLDVEMAVVVQKMINSDKSGVAFSQSPVGEKNEILIEAAFGLGEAIVSGSVTPDEYRVDKKTKQITKRKVNKQSIYHIKEGSKTVEKELPEEKQEQKVLSDEEILKITNVSLKVEEHYNFPQDIEWAFENNKLFVLQTRPITD